MWRLTTFSHPRSLLIWLILQLLVLLIPVTQLPLSEEFARPAEKLAIDEMLVAQIALSALVGQILIPSGASMLVLAAASWPFLQLAGILSSTPPQCTLEASAVVTIWILSLGILLAENSNGRFRVYSCAIASALAIGGAIAAYLRAEFGTGEANPLLFGPIIAALEIVHATEAREEAWRYIFALFPLSVAVRYTLIKVRHRRSQQLVHNFGG